MRYEVIIEQSGKLHGNTWIGNKSTEWFKQGLSSKFPKGTIIHHIKPLKNEKLGNKQEALLASSALDH